MSNLKDRLDEFKKTFESGAPPYNATPERVATMHRATAELRHPELKVVHSKSATAPRISLYLIRTMSRCRRKICFERVQWL